MNASEPNVSVVIPTYRRPELVQRAVQSALAQTMGDVEVLVVVDGLDAETITPLRELEERDSRLRVILPPHRLGNGGARNLGVAQARGKWIAFLDDDDYWMPGKLAAQLSAAEGTGGDDVIVSCRLIARTEEREFHWPRRLPRPGEPIGDYLFCGSTPFTGEGLVQTSSVLVSRKLALAVPFATNLKRYVDVDWLLRVAHEHRATLSFPQGDEPLSVWTIEEKRDRISAHHDWKSAFAWAQSVRPLLSRRAYAGLLLTLISSAAAGERAGSRAAMTILAEAIRHGRPRPASLATHLANTLMPRAAKRRAAATFASLGRRQAKGASA